MVGEAFTGAAWGGGLGRAAGGAVAGSSDATAGDGVLFCASGARRSGIGGTVSTGVARCSVIQYQPP